MSLLRFIATPNFTPELFTLLHLFDGGAPEDRTYEAFPYPQGTPNKEWLSVVGKSVPKPFLISLSEGMLANAVTKALLRESGCSFVYLSDGWLDKGWGDQARMLTTHWMKAVDA